MSALPADLLTSILLHLSHADDMLACACVSQALRTAAELASEMQLRGLRGMRKPTHGVSWTRLNLIRMSQGAAGRKCPSVLQESFTRAEARQLRHGGADAALVDAALRWELEVNILLDMLDEIGYLLSIEGVAEEQLRARSSERQLLVARMALLRLHRDGVLTLIGLDAVGAAKARAAGTAASSQHAALLAPEAEAVEWSQSSDVGRFVGTWLALALAYVISWVVQGVYVREALRRIS